MLPTHWRHSICQQSHSMFVHMFAEIDIHTYIHTCFVYVLVYIFKQKSSSTPNDLPKQKPIRQTRYTFVRSIRIMIIKCSRLARACDARRNVRYPVCVCMLIYSAYFKVVPINDGTPVAETFLACEVCSSKNITPCELFNGRVKTTKKPLHE